MNQLLSCSVSLASILVCFIGNTSKADNCVEDGAQLHSSTLLHTYLKHDTKPSHTRLSQASSHKLIYQLTLSPAHTQNLHTPTCTTTSTPLHMQIQSHRCTFMIHLCLSTATLTLAGPAHTVHLPVNRCWERRQENRERGGAGRERGREGGREEGRKQRGQGKGEGELENKWFL